MIFYTEDKIFGKEHFFRVCEQENDEQASSPSGSETPGPQRPRSNSGRELTDEVFCVRLCFCDYGW